MYFFVDIYLFWLYLWSHIQNHFHFHSIDHFAKTFSLLKEKDRSTIIYTLKCMDIKKFCSKINKKDIIQKDDKISIYVVGF